MGWAGMRGGVSLAAALAIPATLDSGAPFPHRELILFITFGVIVFTVVGQGLTLPILIRRLGVLDDGSEEEAEELLGRMEAAQAALLWLEDSAGVGGQGGHRPAGPPPLRVPLPALLRAGRRDR